MRKMYEESVELVEIITGKHETHTLNPNTYNYKTTIEIVSKK